MQYLHMETQGIMDSTIFIPRTLVSPYSPLVSRESFFNSVILHIPFYAGTIYTNIYTNTEEMAPVILSVKLSITPSQF